nr:HIT domain-containing protein [Candidatus Aquiluna sp. UB-MaderosW2red]
MEESLDCIFCKIVASELPTELLGENEFAIAFKDINPLAMVHILVVPRIHSSDISRLSDPQTLLGLHELVREMAAKFTDGQFRLQFNTGEREGQSVFHTHAHILSQQGS